MDILVKKCSLTRDRQKSMQNTLVLENTFKIENIIPANVDQLEVKHVKAALAQSAVNEEKHFDIFYKNTKPIHKLHIQTFVDCGNTKFRDLKISNFSGKCDLKKCALQVRAFRRKTQC